MTHRYSRGFSLAEMLTVVAIIGVLSLISVPAFINYQRANYLRSAVRAVAQDMRKCRQAAITRNALVRMQFVSSTQYQLQQSLDNGTTWTALRVAGHAEEYKTLEKNVTFDTPPFSDDEKDEDKYPDIDFKKDGTVDEEGKLVLRTAWADAPINKAEFTLSTTGQLTTKTSKE
ncbi:MAG: Tfp pilus assembly protein FimT/FimU [Thermoanaerobaculia bacterium]